MLGDIVTVTAGTSNGQRQYFNFYLLSDIFCDFFIYVIFLFFFNWVSVGCFPEFFRINRNRALKSKGRCAVQSNFTD